MSAHMSEVRLARAKQRRVQKTAKLGTGKRFAAVEAVARAGGARNPAAVAAVAGRRAHGATTMARLAAAGRRRRAAKRRTS